MPPAFCIMRIRLDPATRRSGDSTGFDDRSLELAAGAFVTVVGPPGAGKSALLRGLADEASGGGSSASAVTLIEPEASVPLTADRSAAADVVLHDDLRGHPEGDDPAARRRYLRAWGGDGRRTVVYATRDPDDALALSDRVVVLRAGRLEQAAPPDRLLDTPATEFVAAYFGHPTINLIPAILEKDGQAIVIGNQSVALAGRIAEEFCRDITVGIRPHHVRLQREPVGWRGRVVSQEETTARNLVTVEVEGVRLRALTPAPFGPGETVFVRVLPKHYVVFDDRGVRLEQR